MIIFRWFSRFIDWLTSHMSERKEQERNDLDTSILDAWNKRPRGEE